MRRVVFLSMGVLELACAVVLVVFAWQLPGRGDVDEAAGRIEKVGRNAGREVRALRAQCGRLRQRQPELLTLSRKLEKQMRQVAQHVHGESLNDDGLATVPEALTQIAQGLDGLAVTLDPKGLATIAQGLGTTASYLDEKVVPAAEKAAGVLEKATAGLKADAGKLTKFLEEVPLELQTTKAMGESLARFEEGLERLTTLAKVENFESIREGFKGLESSLETGAGQVDKMDKFTIPKVTFRGFLPDVQEKPFWPESKKAAEGMRKAAKGCQAAGKEMEAFNKQLPAFRASIEQSRKVVSTTREALTTALARQEKVEPVLKRLPQHLARLADDLPQLTGELARVLRETARLKEVAQALRQAEKGVETASARWPELRTSLGKSAGLLRVTQKQLQGALAHREDYEALFQQTVALTTMFAEALPVLIRQLEEGLSQQESSLDDLGDSIDQVTDAVPAAARSAADVLGTTRVLLTLVALVVALHACHLLVSARRRPAPAG